ncbi:MAG: hydantoinase/oxoprolinase family protein [Alphaproteobacteria bacterium]|nr:hydantoinase/oxoprolinase family protein [Alphaproteobacteria bacterium]
MKTQSKARLAVDIGGTFTDVAIQAPGEISGYITAKCLTTPDDPVTGAMTGVTSALERAGLSPSDVGSFIHGTTLATNALIERKGATVGVITTEGFRDILEIAYERRYDQYDINIDKPDLYVPRERCFAVPERISAQGEVLKPLDEAALDGVLAGLEAEGVTSIAVCLLHAYANDVHEQAVARLIRQKRPGMAVSLSSEVSPEVREFDRLCTTLANAYVMPLMERYLAALDETLKRSGFDCPFFVMTSGGGMTTLETAIRFPIRLVESGPSGGAILACQIAQAAGCDEAVSFDMGGTTAKICLIDKGRPQTSRHFEIGRAARFIKGSGLPVRIPVIEMIEIGAGGGSIAGMDRLGRITVGPESAGAAPGPACYGRGGSDATVTDSDVALGYIDPEHFAEGRLQIEPEASHSAIERVISAQMGVDLEEGAYGISQIVDENMASAARIHAAEHGKDTSRRTMIAFGGNGPLHATRLADKIGVDRIIVPPNPGVGSAVGFLSAPVSYEIVRSLYMTFGAIDLGAVNRLFDQMVDEASAIVSQGTTAANLTQHRAAFMRYRGQGHEIEVPLPLRNLEEADLDLMREAYDEAYRAQFHRSVEGMEIEIMNWTLMISTPSEPQPEAGSTSNQGAPEAAKSRSVYLRGEGASCAVPVMERDSLAPGHRFNGPALIVEPQTTTFVDAHYGVEIDTGANIILTRSTEEGASHG